MGATTFKTIDGLLTGVMEDVENPDTKYKLRSARQLLAVIQQRHDTLNTAIDTAVNDEDLLQRLQELGYLDPSE